MKKKNKKKKDQEKFDPEASLEETNLHEHKYLNKQKSEKKKSANFEEVRNLEVKNDKKNKNFDIFLFCQGNILVYSEDLVFTNSFIERNVNSDDVTDIGEASGYSLFKKDYFKCITKYLAPQNYIS